MSISLPPRPPELGDSATVDQEALIEEARRRARRRRQRNLAGLLAAMLGTLWLYSLVGGGGPQSGSAFLSESSSQGATPLNEALPEELSYNANGGITLIRRDGTRRVLARQTDRHLPDGRWLIRLYNGIEWSRDGSKLLALRWGSLRTLVVIDAKGVVGPKIAQALDGRWSPDETRIAFVRHVPGLGRVLFLAASDGRGPIRIATHVSAFSWSPDGSRIAYSRAGARGIVIADASGRAVPRRVTIAATVGAPSALGGDVQWSPTRRSSPSRRAASFRRSPGRHVATPCDGRRVPDRVVAGQQAVGGCPGDRRLRRPCRRRRAAPDRPLPVHVPWRDRNVARLVAGRESHRIHQRTWQRREHDPPGWKQRHRRRTAGGSWTLRARGGLAALAPGLVSSAAGLL